MNVGEMLAKARADANVSQSEMAKLMGVDRSTIQRWEENVTKIKLEDAIKGFDALGVPMYPYLMAMLYKKELANANNIANVKKILMNYINELDDFHIMELFFILEGLHGSSPTGTLDMVTAYLHLPLGTRVCVANDVLTHYEIAKAQGQLVNDKRILPKTATLKKCTTAARNAVLDGRSNYTLKEEAE